jgi:hypothetical protein
MLNENDWLSLDKHRETKIFNNGRVVVVKPKNKDLIVPLFCPLCCFPMRTQDDVVSFRENEVCNKCDLYWKKPNENKWATGWKPTTEKEFLLYLKERELHSKPEIAFK